jgi:hypothetical protein
MLFDGNFMKFVESNYKFLSGYSQGGPNLRGDNVIVSVILVSAFIGVILGLVALRHVEKLSLTVLVDVSVSAALFRMPRGVGGVQVDDACT